MIKKDNSWPFEKSMAVFVGVLLGLPVIIGNLIPPDKPKQEHWLPSVNPREGTGVPTRKEVNPNPSIYDWGYDKRRETPKWLEFMEEIEHKGLSPYDPEAQEIWDGYYNY